MPRRVPGSGIGKSNKIAAIDIQQPLTKSAKKPSKSGSVKLRIKPIVPKQWRHLSIVALAIVTSMVGLDSHSVAVSTKQNQLPTARVSQAQAAESVESWLPVVRTINLPPIPVKNQPAANPYFAARGIILIDDSTKIVLYDKGGEDRRAVASTTKVISALVALERFPDLDQRVTISKTALNQIGSGVGFHVGETATVRQLLYGLMMVSGNDAAKALSEQQLPTDPKASTAQWVEDMNTLAKRLGMSSSHFADPAGLFDESSVAATDHGYSTPADMVKAMSALLNQPELVKIIGTADYSYTSTEGFLHTFTNSNRLITQEMYYPGMIGGKTGFTPETPEGGAGHCLLTAAERNGHRLIAAVYGTFSTTPQASAEVARAVLDYGFNNYTWQQVAR